MMLITGRIGRTAAVVVAALGFTFSATASAAYAWTSPCGSACVDQPPVHQSGGLLTAGHGISAAALTRPANSDPAEDW